MVRSLGRKDPLEEVTATHSSILAWRIPWTKEPGRLKSIGSQKVGHNGSDLAHMHEEIRQLQRRARKGLVAGQKKMVLEFLGQDNS